jgi:hypothetical protein
VILWERFATNVETGRFSSNFEAAELASGFAPLCAHFVNARLWRAFMGPFYQALQAALGSFNDNLDGAIQ